MADANDKTDALVAALRELRDTGDVSDWRTMETALTAAIEALAAPAEGGQGEVAFYAPARLVENCRLISGAQSLHRVILSTKQDTDYPVPFYTNPPAASLEDLRQCADDLDSGIDIRIVSAQLRALIDSAGGAKVNEPFGNSEQLRQAAAGFLAASFYPDGDGYTDDMRQTYSYWHKRLLAELRPAGVMEYVQAEASARINARREAASG